MSINVYMHTYVRMNIHTYLPTYLHTYMHTYMDVYMLTGCLWFCGSLESQTTCMRTYVCVNIHTYLLTYLPTYMHTYMHTYMSNDRCLGAYGSVVHLKFRRPANHYCGPSKLQLDYWVSLVREIKVCICVYVCI